MPVLKKSKCTEEDRRKFAELALGIESPLKDFSQAIQANSQAFKSILDPAINEAIKSMALSFENPIFQIGQNISKMVSGFAILQLRDSFKILDRSQHHPNIIDGDFEQKDDDLQSSASTENALIPQQQYVPVPILKPSKRTKMGLKEVNGGFKYKGRVLKGLSHKNAEGRSLSLFLKSTDCFVKDDQIYETLHIEAGRSFSWVIRNLKNKLKNKNGIKIEFERRWKPDGYIIIDVNYIN